MVTVKEKRVGRKRYFYLEHSMRARESGKVQKKEKYLGTKIPKDIEELKRDFLFESYSEKWYPQFERIKKNHLKEEQRMPKSALEDRVRKFSIRFTYDTNRIEGSRLTLRETADLLERGITPKEKSLDDVKEAENHEKVFFKMLDYGKDLSLSVVLYWHKLLFENTTKKDIAGKLREHQVMISGSKFVPPMPVEVYPLMKEFFRWYDKNKKKLHPVALAALVHLKFVTIHPFSAGNGRMSRLMMNFVLNKDKFPLLNIKYEKRASYYTALERAQVKEQDHIFLQWFFKRYGKEYKSYL